MNRAEDSIYIELAHIVEETLIKECKRRGLVPSDMAIVLGFSLGNVLTVLSKSDTVGDPYEMLDKVVEIVKRYMTNIGIKEPSVQ